MRVILAFMAIVAVGSVSGLFRDGATSVLKLGSQAIKPDFEYDIFNNFEDKSQKAQRAFTTSEVARYDGESGRPLYIIIQSRVYDVTDFAAVFPRMPPQHPAGPEPLKRNAGRDATAAMRASGMPDHVYNFLTKFQVGYIVDS